MMTLNDPKVLDRMDEDQRQEFYCLVLEGFSEKEAAEKSVGARDVVNRRRLSGPSSGDTASGHGERPIISDLYHTDLFEKVTPVTLDTRTDMEREIDWMRDDWVRNEVLPLLADRQREVIDDLFGFDTGTPLSQKECADKRGITLNAVQKARTKGINRIRRMMENPPMTERQRQAHKRELKRLQMQRYRQKKAV